MAGNRSGFQAVNRIMPSVTASRDPGLPDASPRLTDVEPMARQRAKRQVAGGFAVAAVLVIASVVFYFGFIDEAGGDDVNVGDLQVSNLVLGLMLGLAVLLAGVGVVHRSRVLMTGTEVVEHRSEAMAAQYSKTPVEARRALRSGGAGCFATPCSAHSHCCLYQRSGRCAASALAPAANGSTPPGRRVSGW